MLLPHRTNALLLFALLVLSGPLAAQTTTRLTGGVGGWSEPSVDLKGKNLVFTKGNDLYLFSVGRGWISPIACDIDSAQISPGGNFVVFASDSDPLATNSDGNLEIFLYDIKRRHLTQLTIIADPFQSESPSIDGRGRFIAFLSTADFLGTNVDASQEVFLYDRTENTFVQVTDTATGSPSDNVHISANGKFVVFDSTADLVPAGVGGNADLNGEIFGYDIQAATLTQLTNTTSGDCRRPMVSATGRHVSFESDSATNFGANTDGNDEVYRLDRSDSTFLRLTDKAFDSRLPQISGNGKWVTFESAGDHIPPSNADGSSEIFLVQINPDNSTSVSQITDGDLGTTSRRAALTTSAAKIFLQSDADLTGAGAGANHIFLRVRD